MTLLSSLPLLLLLAGAPGVPQPGANPYLAQAKVYFQAAEYERCETRLEQSTSWPSPQAELGEIELYRALCAYHLGNEAEARDHFLLARQFSPDIALPPNVSPKVRTFFAPLLSRPAPPDAPVQPNLSPSMNAPSSASSMATETARTAPASSGVRRPNWLTWALGGTALLATGGSVALGASARSVASQARTEPWADRSAALADTSRSRARLANVGYGAAATAALAAVVSYLWQPDGSQPEEGRP